MDHVHAKQQAVLEKLKQKRAQSLATVSREDETISAPGKETINISKITSSDIKPRDDSLEKAAEIQ